MGNLISPTAIFRLSVLGPLASRDKFNRGELKNIIQQLANQTYRLPNSRTVRVSEKTIESWYYRWRKQGIDGLAPKLRCDRGACQLSTPIQEAILSAKKDNPARSINTLIQLLERTGAVSKGQLSRSTVHRLLKAHQLSHRSITGQEHIERRAFEAEHAGDLWYGDVMHGPRVQTETGLKKVYLVSIMDDASRLICHSSFCLDETALSIEYVLKEALLKRGLPKKLVVDNGPAYRSETLQSVCARLKIRLIYGRPYEPESKGKLERFHRTFRSQFLTELNLEAIQGLDALNQRLWIWIETIYHKTSHGGLAKDVTPLMRFQQDLTKIQSLGPIALHIDEYFYHRIKRAVKKDGTLSYNNKLYEVSFELAQTTVNLVMEPYSQTARYVESLDGEWLSDVVLLNKQSNNHRKRHRPKESPSPISPKSSLVELALEQASKKLDITSI